MDVGERVDEDHRLGADGGRIVGLGGRVVADQRVVITVPRRRLSAHAAQAEFRLLLLMWFDFEFVCTARIYLPVDMTVRTDSSEDKIVFVLKLLFLNALAPAVMAGPGGMAALADHLLLGVARPQGVGQVRQLAAHVDGISQVLGGQHSVRRAQRFSSQIVVRVGSNVAVLIQAEVRLII